MNNISLTLHGFLHLTLTGASPADVRAVMEATGAQRDTSQSRADMEVQMNGRKWQLRDWRNRAGNPQATSTINPAKGRLPVGIDLSGGQHNDCPIRLAYPTGLRRLPLLRSLVNWIATEKGWLGIHGTAFTQGGRGYLVCGGSGSGKTGTMLAYLLQGARYLAAEWAYLSDQGRVIHGVPETLRLREWHVQNAGDRFANIRFGDRLQMAKWRYAAKGLIPICQMLESVSVKQSGRLRNFAHRVDSRR